MKLGYYLKLSADGMRKNRRMYLPYILTCVGMVMMYYIIEFLSFSPVVDGLTGGSTIRELMSFGGWVLAVFSCIFLFYTNSFLIKRRKKEFGLYNMLGMGKRHIGMILFCETVIVFLISAVGGLFFGIALSKFAELGMVRLMDGEADFALSLSFDSIFMALAVFGCISVLILLNGLRQVRFSSAVNLIKSESSGEKPPRGNIIIGLVGVAVLAAGYYMALTVTNAVDAIAWFFPAVILVIIGTYILLIATSVLFCRLLKKNKRYYYKANHFVSVSSMSYRMKRNGAGLASICILATMVLVMISTTTCLYFGEEDSLNFRYPREENIYVRYDNADDFSSDKTAELRSIFNMTVSDFGGSVTNVIDIRYGSVFGMLNEGRFVFDPDEVNMAYSYDSIRHFYFLEEADYIKLTAGAPLGLASDETYLLSHNCRYDDAVISFGEYGTYRVRGREDGRLEELNDEFSDSLGSIYLVVADIDDFVGGFLEKHDKDPDKIQPLSVCWNYCFDTGLDNEAQKELAALLIDIVGSGEFDFYSISSESREFNREDFFGTYGGILYVAIILSIVFITAAVLIIYYKQTSEGYEDKARFEIMQKVGMTAREIKSSIRSQLLTVFFLPLVLAGIHLAFAFPMTRKILLCFGLENVGLFAVTTLISFAVFAVFYMVIYRATSKAYFNIVSGHKE